MPSLSVIVFAFDEEENVAAVLGELMEWLRANEPDAEIIFIDDGSRDRTLENAEAALAGFPHRALRHETNRGIGAALKSGVRLDTEGPGRGTAVSFVSSKSMRARMDVNSAKRFVSPLGCALEAIAGMPRSAPSRAAATVPE